MHIRNRDNLTCVNHDIVATRVRELNACACETIAQEQWKAINQKLKLESLTRTNRLLIYNYARAKQW